MSLTAKINLGLLLAGIAVGFALPYVVSGFILTTATLALVYGLFAMSIDLMAGYGGLVSLGHAGVMGAAAYGVGYVATHTGGGHLEQVLAGLLAGMLVSAIFALMAMRSSGVYFLMVTLAQGVAVHGLATTLQPVTGAENGLVGIYRPATVTRDWQYYYLCLAVLLLSAGLLQVIVRSPFGLALRGLRESESRLQMVGYSSVGHRFYAFLLSGLFASFAGVLFAYNNQFVSPSVTEFGTSAQAVLMVVLGGIGTLVGPLIGAFAIVFVQNVVSVDVERWPTLMGLIFILMMLFARDGFVGGLRRAWNALLSRLATVPRAATSASGPVPAPLPGALDSDADGGDGAHDDGPPSSSSRSFRGGRARNGQVTPSAAPPALRLDAVTVRFDGVIAVREVSMRLEQGDRWALIGPNGAGKTSLFGVVSGELRATGGRVELFGEDVTHAPPYQRAHRGLGRTYQTTNLFPGLTVEENVMIAVHSVDRRRLRCWWPVRLQGQLSERVERTLHQTDLTRRRHRLVRELSHGEQRELELALALASQPRLLLLDEPAAGLSASERQRMRDLVQQLPPELSLVLIEHDMSLALELVDRVVCMDNGDVIATGTPDEIRANEQVQAVYLKSD